MVGDLGDPEESEANPFPQKRVSNSKIGFVVRKYEHSVG